MNKIKMLYCDKIDIPEEMGANKTSTLKVSDICYYWLSLNKGFKFQPYL